ncbi:hypothetical protein HanXRQr2_Chr07g0309541 [Helianthus annuus]|uniref:Uncharacterized protein n=1 Tax=Helianthus annuus TaxID=4232 RepID=A0A9K3IN24_HELAN|nr:hypothetical protein HanXRQr2_Chr07g0309541 [Helianthus annuus]KAJ0905928.1 hypothetical protein HanPSC8_Chr07g0299651 [Helianthus annuus]
MSSNPPDLNTFAASTRSSFKPLRKRESKDAAIVGAAIDRSAACWTTVRFSHLLPHRKHPFRDITDRVPPWLFLSFRCFRTTRYHRR